MRRSAGRPRTRRLRRRMQSDGMIILPDTEDLGVLSSEESNEGLIESEQNSDNQNESYKDLME